MGIRAFRTSIVPVDHSAADAARERIDQLTKPQGSLGRLETLAVQLAAISGEIPPGTYERRTVVIGVGDHGVTEEGVSAYPSEVTAQMVRGFLGGSAAINAFARVARAEVFVAVFGMREPLAPHSRLLDLAVGRGTHNLARRAPIERADVETALLAGVTAFDSIVAKSPCDVIALGEMGIGNTTSAAAIVSAFTGKPARVVVGRGTGIDDERLERKIAAVEAALRRCEDFTWDEIAAEGGGYEILGLAGIILRAAQARLPIVLDGFIVSAAALIAGAIAPNALGYCIAGHRSQERGHGIALDALGLSALIDLDLRLGEASGAVLALPLIEAAARMVREMKTFAQAGVATKVAELPVAVIN
jgi:nicotinate-nucleotide--dimethylbenzimidazole phosphoribosyltransferase